MIKHAVNWKLAAEDAEGKSRAFAEIAEALGALPALIPEIKAFHIGADLGDVAENWDVSLIIDFAGTAELETYQTHPEHLKAAAIVRAHTAARATVDYEF
jgi:hypothetical protein